MSKYQHLEDHLRALHTAEWRASFRAIEQVIRATLPASARAYPAWWSNNPSNNVMTTSWLNAGWSTENLDIPGEKVTFRRSRKASLHDVISKRDEALTSKPSGKKVMGDIIVLQGISEETLHSLRRRAAAHQHSLEDEIIALLETNIGTIDRLSQIRSIRDSLPADLNVDLAAIIRDGRDSR